MRRMQRVVTKNLEDAFVVNDSPDLANLVLDDHLSVILVYVIDSSCAFTLCLLGYVAVFQRYVALFQRHNQGDKLQDLAIIFRILQ